MPMLANQRHEEFARGLARGKTIDQAYQDAGFKPNRSNASRLNSNDSIQNRVAELQERAATNVVLSREWVLEQLIDNAMKAKLRNDGSVANRALELLGKEIGMFVDRKEIRTGPLDEATPDELEQLREELVSLRTGRIAGGSGTAPSGKPN